MSKIIAKDDLEKNNWKIQFDNLSSHYADLQIGFTKEKPIVTFKGLKFGFTLKQGEQIIDTQTYPPKGVVYLSTDQEYVVTHRLKFKPDLEYQLFLWAENDKKSIQHTETFTTPKPLQPYPSWTWDGETWNPPIPYPQDGKDYQWDEDSLSWIEYKEQE